MRTKKVKQMGNCFRIYINKTMNVKCTSNSEWERKLHNFFSGVDFGHKSEWRVFFNLPFFIPQNDSNGKHVGTTIDLTISESTNMIKDPGDPKSLRPWYSIVNDCEIWLNDISCIVSREEGREIKTRPKYEKVEVTIVLIDDFSSNVMLMFREKETTRRPSSSTDLGNIIEEIFVNENAALPMILRFDSFSKEILVNFLQK